MSLSRKLWRSAGLFCLLAGSCAPRGPTTTAFDGVYQGQVFVTDPGLPCQAPSSVNPMRVSGGHVEFGNVRGWVQPDGQLSMVFGQVRVVGQFQGTHFSGVVYNPQPSCNFGLNMNKVS